MISVKKIQVEMIITKGCFQKKTKNQNRNILSIEFDPATGFIYFQYYLCTSFQRNFIKLSSNNIPIFDKNINQGIIDNKGVTKYDR